MKCQWYGYSTTVTTGSAMQHEASNYTNESKMSSTAGSQHYSKSVVTWGNQLLSFRCQHYRKTKLSLNPALIMAAAPRPARTILIERPWPIRASPFTITSRASWSNTDHQSLPLNNRKEAFVYLYTVSMGKLYECIASLTVLSFLLAVLLNCHTADSSALVWIEQFLKKKSTSFHPLNGLSALSTAKVIIAFSAIHCQSLIDPSTLPPSIHVNPSFNSLSLYLSICSAVSLSIASSIQ